MSYANTRDVGLDVTRGIAILMVIAGHVFEPPINTLIYVFHMPFFFLIGGYFYRSQDVLSELIRRFNQLIVPYSIFLLIISLPELFGAIYRNGTDDIFWRLRRLLVGGEGLVAPFTVFWFPTCYFFTAVIYNAMRSRLGRRSMWAVCLGLLVLAIINQYVTPQFWLPWALNVTAMAIPMFHIGVVFGRYIFQPSQELIVAFAAIAITYLVVVIVLQAPPMAMKRADYGIPFITLLAAITCSSVLAGAGSIVARSVWLSKPLLYCGAASMTIMYVHMPVVVIAAKLGLENAWLEFLFAFAVCLAAHAIFSFFPASRRLLLGQFSPPR